MKLPRYLHNLRLAVVVGLLCCAVFHLYDLDHRRQSDIAERKLALQHRSSSTLEPIAQGDRSMQTAQTAQTAQVIALPTTDGAYVNDIEANFHQGVMQTAGETAVGYLVIIAFFSLLKQILRIRAEGAVRAFAKSQKSH